MWCMGVKARGSGPRNLMLTERALHKLSHLTNPVVSIFWQGFTVENHAAKLKGIMEGPQLDLVCSCQAECFCNTTVATSLISNNAKSNTIANFYIMLLITKGNSLNIINKNNQYFKTKHKKQASGSCFDCHGILKKQMQPLCKHFHSLYVMVSF